MSRIHLVLGGARSGKSAFAERLIPDDAAAVTYVATARPLVDDTEFAERIAAHQQRRPSQWRTVDDVDLSEVMADLPAGDVLVDDLGTWMTYQCDINHAWDGDVAAVRHTIDQLVARLADIAADSRDDLLIFVSPEVGLAIIPEHRSGRILRDLLGELNARIAAVADQVDLIVAGCQLSLKS
ncbi:bifunctional adenosylcobinamide kinase/adenosylcobinamide-phosphate guanylyltransferase [Corynebacterium choanae]|uniref:Adenosylcobinamide kinase n=1 Tax=Corynebacterium choanae TaxID=1862358 RepID=A0A3G6J877_9CORY|nr:bifunctional adenosylcobinamide kinase/adenosylcobinamide-phosphate guanylyltransferase [Corynebacterium choanae]AZA13983.1 Bifunctional adenosylcobalamin biosynthesis protein CobP [Corynebacterium choanae]